MWIIKYTMIKKTHEGINEHLNDGYTIIGVSEENFKNLSAI